MPARAAVSAVDAAPLSSSNEDAGLLVAAAAALLTSAHAGERDSANELIGLIAVAGVVGVAEVRTRLLSGAGIERWKEVALSAAQYNHINAVARTIELVCALSCDSDDHQVCGAGWCKWPDANDTGCYPADACG
jgi:hypothetical protein